ncbi:hypothetical protein WMF45_34545 [Sorangium sp. So ce448]|uniref:hypothetical protein n=1 Tax=Sorangium sp. So ce448 TaxID=3133314 RepID=UPI003F61193F
MRHVFVETNWVVDYAAPAHHKKKAAVDLLDRAAAGEIELHLPSICLNEARRPIQELKPRHEADAIRQFLRWSKANGKISIDEEATALRVLSMFESRVKEELKQLDAMLTSLRKHPGLDVFALDDAMLERAIELSGGELEFVKPFDQAILAAVLVRAEMLRAAGATDLSFCELDGDLQPWGKNGSSKPALTKLYDAAGIWVYGDFDLAAPVRPAS